MIASIFYRRAADETRLLQEAVEYAVDFDKEEDTDSFWVGCSNFDTNKAFLFSIEAARLLAGGIDGEPFAIRLLQMAIEDIEDAQRQRKARAKWPDSRATVGATRHST